MITKKELLNKGFDMNPILEQKENKTSDFVDMMSLLLHSQTQVHALHLQTKSYSEHKALQNYYEGIDGLVDGIIESYQGKYDIITGYKSYDLINYKSTEATIKYLKGLDDNIQKLRDCCKDTFIQNQIDNVNELINSTLYKLRFLK
jgi:hypothetical protein